MFRKNLYLHHPKDVYLVSIKRSRSRPGSSAPEDARVNGMNPSKRKSKSPDAITPRLLHIVGPPRVSRLPLVSGGKHLLPRPLGAQAPFVGMDSEITILIAEDDPNDVMLLELAIRRNGIANPVRVVRDGEEAVEYLEGQGKYADRQKYPLPSVIISDVKMPRRSGLEVVEWVRHHPRCAIIPIVMLSGSRIENDVVRAYSLGANSYFTKPSTLDELTELIGLAHAYWTKCEHPPAPKVHQKAENR
jgi:CheY-like chemotaxis protein